MGYVEIDISDEDYEMLKAYQKELGFDTLDDLIVYILREELEKDEEEDGNEKNKKI